MVVAPHSSPALSSNKPPFGAVRDPAARPLRPCTVSITMRAKDALPVTCVPQRSKAAQRKRRLARGVARWEFDRTLCAEPTRRIATLTFTVPESDPGAAQGWIRDFWAKVRKRWLGTRYFCWLELQARGAAHYHAVWLNPPSLNRVNLLAWVEHAWGHGRTRVRFSDGHGGMQREIQYAIGYSKKMGRKAYQQRYDQVPSSLRTFMSQRLEIPPTVVDEHLDREIWTYRAGSPPGGPPSLHGYYLEYFGQVEHLVDRPSWCTAARYRRSRTPPTRIFKGRTARRL